MRRARGNGPLRNAAGLKKPTLMLVADMDNPDYTERATGMGYANRPSDREKNDGKRRSEITQTSLMRDQ